MNSLVKKVVVFGMSAVCLVSAPAIPAVNKILPQTITTVEASGWGTGFRLGGLWRFDRVSDFPSDAEIRKYAADRGDANNQYFSIIKNFRTTWKDLPIRQAPNTWATSYVTIPGGRNIDVFYKVLGSDGNYWALCRYYNGYAWHYGYVNAHYLY